MKAIRIHGRGGPEHLVYEDVTTTTSRSGRGAGAGLLRRGSLSTS